MWASILSWFIGGSKSADKVIDGAIKAGDALVFTDEEKANNSNKAMELWIKFQEATLPQNETRRSIAILIIVLWVLLVFLTAISLIIGTLLQLEVFKLLYDKLFLFIREIVNDPFMLIMVFYFLKRIIPGQK